MKEELIQAYNYANVLKNVDKYNLLVSYRKPVTKQKKRKKDASSNDINLKALKSHLNNLTSVNYLSYMQLAKEHMEQKTEKVLGDITREELIKMYQDRIKLIEKTISVEKSEEQNKDIKVMIPDKTISLPPHPKTIYLITDAIDYGSSLEIEYRDETGATIRMTVPKGVEGRYITNNGDMTRDILATTRGIRVQLDEIFAFENCSERNDYKMFLVNLPTNLEKRVNKINDGHLKSIAARSIQKIKLNLPAIINIHQDILGLIVSIFDNSLGIETISKKAQILLNNILKSELDKDSGNSVYSDLNEKELDNVFRFLITLYELPYVEDSVGTITPIVRVVGDSSVATQLVLNFPTDYTPKGMIAETNHTGASISKRSTSIIKEPLKLKTETRGSDNYRKIHINNLKKIIRDKRIERELMCSLNMNTYSRPIVMELISRQNLKEFSVEEAFSDIDTILIDYLYEIGKDMKVVKDFGFRLMNIASLASEKLDISDPTLHVIVPYMNFLKSYFSGKSKIVKQDILDLDTREKENLFRHLIAMPYISMDKGNGLINALVDATQTPDIILGDDLVTGEDLYLDYVKGLIYKIVNQSATSINKSQLDTVLEVFATVMGTNYDELYYYTPVVDIKEEDIDTSGLEVLLSLNAYMALQIAKTESRKLKDVGSMNIKHLLEQSTHVPDSRLSLKSLEISNDIDIVRDYNILSLIIEKVQQKAVSADKISSNFIKRINSNKTLETVLENASINTDDYRDIIVNTLAPFNELERFLILTNTLKELSITDDVLLDLSESKSKTDIPIQEISAQVSLMYKNINKWSKLTPLIPYEMMLPKIMEAQETIDTLMQDVIYRKPKVYTEAEIQKNRLLYRKCIMEGGNINEVNLDLISYDDLTVTTLEYRGLYSIVTLKEEYENLAFGQKINLNSLDTELESVLKTQETPEMYLAEVIENRDDIEYLYLPKEMKLAVERYVSTLPQIEGRRKVLSVINKEI